MYRYFSKLSGHSPASPALCAIQVCLRHPPQIPRSPRYSIGLCSSSHAVVRKFHTAAYLSSLDDVMDNSMKVDTKRIYSPNPKISAGAAVRTMEEYASLYARSVADDMSNDQFWDEQAKSLLTWFRPYSRVRQGQFSQHSSDVSWFLDGQLNVSYNCLDRHLPYRAHHTAIIWEGDEPSDVRRITYGELHGRVCELANALKRRGVQKGDTVAIYMPMVPEAAMAMLACARIGAVHSVVFAGFSAEALASRIQDARCKVVITSDEGKRGGRRFPLKAAVDSALHLVDHDLVKHVLVLKHTGGKVLMKPGRDEWLSDAMKQERPYCPAEPLDSESPLFLLYTSGSTGKPKGLLHTQAGYLLYAMLTHRLVFDIREDDVYACVADIGWITGHSYIVYGPLANGATTVMFESIPNYPDAGRYWDMVQRHRINILYTAPTAIRALMKFGDEPVKKYDRSSLRVLGSVGEPISPAAWEWYYKVVGDSKCSVVDTYWQTETGGIIFAPLPGATPMKPGSCTLPLPGIEPVLLDEKTGDILKGNNVKGVLAISRSWPGIARTISGDHSRFLDVYMNPYKGFYFTGDGAYRDEDGYYWIIGRVDDVLNVAGHRLGTAELEAAFVLHPAAAEAAVVGIPHPVKGTGIVAFVVLKEGYHPSTELADELRTAVRQHVSPIATPEAVHLVPALPKTRSGKIMRRLLRKLASGERRISELGDTSTLADPNVVEEIIKIIEAHSK